MDWLKLPPLNSLRAFAAVADAGSYRLAADRLNVTQAAVSQQVKALEQRLGVALVERLGRSIELTPQGKDLAGELAIGFDIIGRGVERLTEQAINRPVQITMSPAFAVEWLLPRMAEFQRNHPEILCQITGHRIGEMLQLTRQPVDHDQRLSRLAAYFQQSAVWVLVFILSYIACFALSVGPVTWVILSEVFPTQIRTTAQIS